MLSQTDSIPHIQYVPQIHELQRINNFYMCMILVKKLTSGAKKYEHSFQPMLGIRYIIRRKVSKCI